MNTDTLKKIGLSDSEIRVYISLLELGQTTTGPLVKKTGVPSSKIYHILGSLTDKGLVGHVIHGKVKKFRANRPTALRHLLDKREQETAQIK
ncbi:MAG: helix-turn-helix domain-containing protein, partial [Candidatus Micrarchaeota archaeon]|nr:helix-turn-helix domain-containing protein [Candidatus Micrarchaeota archaeon]